MVVAKWAIKFTLAIGPKSVDRRLLEASSPLDINLQLYNNNFRYDREGCDPSAYHPAIPPRRFEGIGHHCPTILPRRERMAIRVTCFLLKILSCFDPAVPGRAPSLYWNHRRLFSLPFYLFVLHTWQIPLMWNIHCCIVCWGDFDGLSILNLVSSVNS